MTSPSVHPTSDVGVGEIVGLRDKAVEILDGLGRDGLTDEQYGAVRANLGAVIFALHSSIVVCGVGVEPMVAPDPKVNDNPPELAEDVEQASAQPAPEEPTETLAAEHDATETDPIDNPWTDMDWEQIEANNRKAEEDFGGTVRFVRLIDGETITIDGHVINLFNHNTRGDRKHSRIDTLKLFFQRRGTDIGVQEIRDATGIVAPAGSVKKTMEETVDRHGVPIIDIEKLGPKRSRYSLAPDIIIKLGALEPNRGGATVEPAEPAEPSEPLKLRGITDLTPPAVTPPAPEPAPKTEPAKPPEEPIRVSRKLLVVDGHEFPVSLEASGLLGELKRTRRALNEKEVTQSLLGREEVADDQCIKNGVVLFALYKQGLLNNEYVSERTPSYSINPDAVETTASRHKQEIDGKTVYFDDLDIKILQQLLLSNSVYGPDLRNLASRVGLKAPNPREADEFSRRVVKYMLEVGVVVQDSRGDGFRINGAHFEQIQEFVKAVGGEAVFSRPDQSGAPKGNGEQPPQPGAKPAVELHTNCLVTGGEISRTFNPVETRFLEWLNRDFGVEVPEEDIIGEFWGGQVDNDTRFAYRATLLPFVTDLIDLGLLQRKKHGGRHSLRLLKPLGAEI